MTLWPSRSTESPVFEHVRIGPRHISGHSVLLRPPTFGDFEAWRRLRMRDREFIEPYWITSPLDWPQRHTRKRWVRECMIQRARARERTDLALAVEVDGRFAGQCALSAIDFSAGTAELGIWVDVTLGKAGVGALAATLVLDYGFELLGLQRIVAPICTDNMPASRSAERVGFIREAVMPNHFDVGGALKDHVIYGMHASGLPVEGLTSRWINDYESSHQRRSVSTEAPMFENDQFTWRQRLLSYPAVLTYFGGRTRARVLRFWGVLHHESGREEL